MQNNFKILVQAIKFCIVRSFKLQLGKNIISKEHNRIGSNCRYKQLNVSWGFFLQCRSLYGLYVNTHSYSDLVKLAQILQLNGMYVNLRIFFPFFLPF